MLAAQTVKQYLKNCLRIINAKEKILLWSHGLNPQDMASKDIAKDCLQVALKI